MPDQTKKVCKDCGSVETDRQRQYDLDCQCGGTFVFEPDQTEKKPMGARERFEKWCDGFSTAFPLQKDSAGNYLSVLTGNVWVLAQREYEAGRRDAQAENERLRAVLEKIAEECKVFDGACEWGHKEEFAAIRTKARAAQPMSEREMNAAFVQWCPFKILDPEKAPKTVKLVEAYRHAFEAGWQAARAGMGEQNANNCTK